MIGIGTILFKTYKNVDIDAILESESYAYLPTEAKEYLKGVYEETGEIILTEKNKENNTPYLNPLYVSYLGMSEEEKQKEGIIPNPTIIDYADNDDVSNVEYPEKYDSRNVSGKNYVTPVRNQGGLGVCWAFTTASVFETYIMKTDDNTYTNSSQLISERQIDYATANNSIKDYDSEYVSFVDRTLGDGGNFYISTVAMANGVSLVDYSWKEYNDKDLNKMELHEVLNYDNSLYEVNSTINMPWLNTKELDDSAESETIRTNFINEVKNNIMKYGAAYVGTYANDRCAYVESSLGNTVIDVDSSCVGFGGSHAMTIIGWDDTIEYDYCKDTAYHKDDISSCTNVVKGKGAWILKNSWGEESTPYPYLAYDSSYSSIHFVSGATKNDEKKWDNNYVLGSDNSLTSSIVSLSNESIYEDEKLTSIKFISESAQATYNIKILQADGTWTKIYSVTKELPGLVTLDLSTENILINNNSQIYIASSYSYVFLENISVFTINISNDEYIDLSEYENVTIYDNEFRFYSETKNIPSNAVLKYEIYDKNNNNMTDYVKITNNIVAENNVSTLISSLSSLSQDNYTIKVSYNDEQLASIKFYNHKEMTGSGTEDDPYLLYSESDLNQMRYDLDAYYLLKNDINLTENWVPIGTYDEPFSGGFDGGNYIISGMNIEGDTTESVGLFGYVGIKYPYETEMDFTTGVSTYFLEKTYIKNVTLKDANVSNKGNAGILIGQVIYTPDIPDGAFHLTINPSLNIDNVHFVGGNVKSLTGDAGAIIGNIDIIPKGGVTLELIINDVYSSATLSGYHSVGLIGYINDFYESGAGIMLNLEMSNFQNVGIIDQSMFDIAYNAKNYYSPVIGGVYGNAKIDLSNYVINSVFSDGIYMTYFAESVAIYKEQLYFIGSYEQETSKNLSYSLSNGYYIHGYGAGINNEGMFVSSEDIKDASLYESWTDFYKYWEIKTIDSITRIPVLKGAEHNYTNIDDIHLKKYNEVSLLDYIEGQSEYKYISYKVISNDNIIEIEDTSSDNRVYDDIRIKALTTGTAVVHIVNDYDGFEKDISITVTADKVDYPVVTYLMDDTDDAENYTQQVTALETITLLKNRFTKIGYTFSGWNTNPNGTGTSYTDEQIVENGFDEDIRLYAQWEKIKYTLKFNANGGTGTMNDLENISINSSLLIPTNEFTKEGYTFSEWNTVSDGSGISFANKGTISLEQLASNAEGNVLTLYAQWELSYDFKINEYIYNEESNIITDIPVGTTKEELLSNIDLNTGYSAEFDMTGDNIYTGSKVKIYYNNVLYKELTNIVLGDVNGDGNLSIFDIVKINNHIVDETKQLENIYVLAGDYNKDGNLSIFDIVKINNKIVEDGS